MPGPDKPRDATPAEERGVDDTIAARREGTTAKSQDQLDRERDEGTKAAREAELKRQKDIEDAVAETNKNLPVTGGPELNPGNPGHDFETGKPTDTSG